MIDGPEERLHAHLDGLVLGGQRVAEKLLVPALADADEGKVFAAAWTLVQAEAPDPTDYLGVVLDALASAKPARRGPRSAGRSSSAGAPIPRGPWRAPGRRAIRWCGAPCSTPSPSTTRSGRARVWPSAPVLAISTSMRSALRALRRAPAPERAAHAERVEEALRAGDPGVRQEAIATGYVMGTRGLRDACRREAQAAGDECRLALALMAGRGDATGPIARGSWRALAVPEARRHVLWALAFAGDVTAADALVEAMDDAKVARVAGESFAAITGVSIAGRFVTPGVTKGPGVEDVEPDDPPPEALPEDLLLVPAPDAVRKWWGKARGRMQGGSRYLYGEPRQPGGSIATIRRASMWRWPVLALEAAVATGAVIDVRGWAKKRK